MATPEPGIHTGTARQSTNIRQEPPTTALTGTQPARTVSRSHGLTSRTGLNGHWD